MEDVLAREQVRESKRGPWEEDAQQLGLSMLGKHLKTTEMVRTSIHLAQRDLAICYIYIITNSIPHLESNSN